LERAVQEGRAALNSLRTSATEGNTGRALSGDHRDVPGLPTTLELQWPPNAAPHSVCRRVLEHQQPFLHS